MKQGRSGGSQVDPLSLTDEQFLRRAQNICATKAAYVTRAEAVTAMKRGSFKGKPYLCPFCGHYHCHTQGGHYARAFTRRLSRIMRHIPKPPTAFC